MKKVTLIFLSIVLVFCSTVFIGCGELNFPTQALTEYSIVCEYNSENRTLSALQKVEYYNNTSSALGNIDFALHANAFREDSLSQVVSLSLHAKAYYNGESFGYIDIKTVSIYDEPAVFEICGEDKNVLSVKLNEELFPNEKVVIEMQYEVVLAQINHRLGEGENTVNLGNFFPIVCVYENNTFKSNVYTSNGDPFYSEVANFNVEITYPDHFIIATSGVAETNVDTEQKTTKSLAKSVRDFAIVLSDNFQVLSKQVGDTRISYYFYNDESSTRSLETACDALACFNELFGVYPYKTFSVVQSSFVHGGMEFPNLIMISDQVADEVSYRNVIIHETAHQWWYGVVGNDQYSYGWLDEGLTEYTTALFYDYNKGYGLNRNLVVSNATSNYKVFEKAYKKVYGEVDTSMNRSLNQFATEPEYVLIAYVKGMLLFDSLHELLGSKVFLKGLQIYYRNSAFKIATPQDLVWAFDKASGKKMEGFFNSWIEGHVIIK